MVQDKALGVWLSAMAFIINSLWAGSLCAEFFPTAKMPLLALPITPSIGAVGETSFPVSFFPIPHPQTLHEIIKQLWFAKSQNPLCSIRYIIQRRRSGRNLEEELSRGDMR